MSSIKLSTHDMDAVACHSPAPSSVKPKKRWFVTRGWIIAVVSVMFCGSGCVNVHGLEDIRVDAGRRPRRIDSSHVPDTANHAEARQRLAEAYERNRYLEHKVEKLEAEKRKLKAERDDYKHRYKLEKKRNDD